MPIVILQGSTKQEGKKIIKNAAVPPLRPEPGRRLSPQKDGSIDTASKEEMSPCSSNDEFTPIKDIATNMADVIDFKVYKVSKPHFVDGTTTVTLVGGDLFYNDDEVRHFTTNKTIDTGIMRQIHTINARNDTKARKSRRKSIKRHHAKHSNSEGTDDVWTDDEEHNQDISKPQKEKFPTLLQKMRAFKQVTKRKDERSFILQHIEVDSQRFKRVKAGQSLWSQMKEPTLEETLDWAIKYVAVNEDQLISMFTDLDNKLRKFEYDLIKAKSPNKERIKFSSSKGISEEQQFNRSKTSFQPTATGTNGNAHQSLLQQLENLKNQGTESFLKAIEPQGPALQKGHRLTNLQLKRIPHPPPSSNPNTSTSVGAPNFTSPATKKLTSDSESNTFGKKGPRTGRKHVVAISPPTDSKPSITDESKSPEASPRSIPITRRSILKTTTFRSSVDMTEQLETGITNKRFSVDTEEQTYDHRSIAEVPEGNGEIDEEIIYHTESNEEMGRSRFRSMSSDISVSSRHTAKRERLKSNPSGSEDEKDKIRKEVSVRGGESTKPVVKKPQPPKDSAPSKVANSKRTRVGFNTLPGTAESDTEKDRENEKDAVVVNTGGAKVQKTVKYSNSAIDNPNINGKIDEITSATQQTIEVMRKGQRAFMKSMGFAMSLFRQANQKQEKMEQKMELKLKRINRTGNHMLVQLQRFHSIEEQHEEKFKQQSKEREIMKISHIKAKLKFMESIDQHIDARSASRAPSPLDSVRSEALNPPVPNSTFTFGAKGCASDFQKIRTLTKEFEQIQTLTAIHDIKWYLNSIYRVKDFMKRMNNNLIPICLLKILLVFHYLVMLKFTITIPLFYQLLLTPEVFQKDDLRKGIVQEVILENIKTGLQISSEDFLAFLELHGFQVPSELLNEVRTNAVASVNSSKSTGTRRNTVLSPQQPTLPKEMRLTDLIEEGDEVSTDTEIPILVLNSVMEPIPLVGKEGLLVQDED